MGYLSQQLITSQLRKFIKDLKEDKAREPWRKRLTAGYWFADQSTPPGLLESGASFWRYPSRLESAPLGRYAGAVLAVEGHRGAAGLGAEPRGAAGVPLGHAPVLHSGHRPRFPGKTPQAMPAPGVFVAWFSNRLKKD